MGKKIIRKKHILFFLIIIIFCLLSPLVTFSQSTSNNGNSEDPWVYKEMGDKYFYLGDYAKAIEYYENALQIKPDYPEVFYMLGKIYKIKKLYDISLQYFKKAEIYKANFQIKDMVIYLMYDISDIYFIMKNFQGFLLYNQRILEYDEYYKYFNKAIYSIMNLVPEKNNIASKAYFRLGYYYFFTGNFETGFKYLIYSKIYSYRLDMSYWLLSKILYLQGNMTQYKDYEAIAASLNPEIKEFDAKYKWKKIPLEMEYLIKMEYFINEFDGIIYLSFMENQ